MFRPRNEQLAIPPSMPTAAVVRVDAGHAVKFSRNMHDGATLQVLASESQTVLATRRSYPKIAVSENHKAAVHASFNI